MPSLFFDSRPLFLQIVSLAISGFLNCRPWLSCPSIFTLSPAITTCSPPVLSPGNYGHSWPIICCLYALGPMHGLFVFGLHCSRYRLHMSTPLCRMAPFLAPPSLIVIRVYHMLILAVPEKPNANINYPGIIHFVGEIGRAHV